MLAAAGHEIPFGVGGVAAANLVSGAGVPPQSLSHSAAARGDGAPSRWRWGSDPLLPVPRILAAVLCPSPPAGMPVWLSLVLHLHRHGARNLRVYGSVSRGQDRPGSDLDLLVDLEQGCSLLEVIALRQELEALLNCQVDLAEAHQLHPLIRDQIIAQATAL